MSDKKSSPALPVGKMITLRDYFAAHALPWLLDHYTSTNKSTHCDERLVADWAYVIADAMLAARELKP